MENYKVTMIDCSLSVVTWQSLLGLQKENFRRVTRNFLGQGSFVRIRALRQTLTYNIRKKVPVGKKSIDFRQETLKNFILNEKFYPQLPQSGHVFLQIGHFFPIFEKGQGRTPPPLPPLVTRLSLIFVYSINHLPQQELNGQYIKPLLKVKMYVNSITISKWKTCQ